MFERVLPRRIDATFRGHGSAAWIFALILVVRIAQGSAVLFGGASVVSGADGIPLDTYSPPAAQAIVSLWALLGLTRLLLCLLCLLVLVRYRSMMSFMFALLLLQDAGRLVVLHFLPIARVGTPPGPVVNVILMVLALAGLVVSLLPGSRRPAPQA